MVSAAAPVQTAEPVIVSLKDLENGSVSFSTLVEAFGPDSLGILVVKDLPKNFPTLRKTVLANSSHLAALPPDTLSQLVNPKAKYLVGWSHGVETLKPGVVDTAKGSYYINYCYQDPSRQGADPVKFPHFEEHTEPNRWPTEDAIPGFRAAAEDLIRLIVETAQLVARACDRYAESAIEGYPPGTVERIVRTSDTTKARLLHYFPTDPSTSSTTVDGNGDDWCATHLDHGCLTGLTSAMFLDENASPPTSVSSGRANVLGDAELPSSPSPRSGLYINSRQGSTYKVSIPRDALAFQTGETLERITQGKFKAVPHFVRGVDPADLRNSKGMENARIARNTLAVFTQPTLDEVIDHRTGQTFLEFARQKVKEYNVEENK